MNKLLFITIVTIFIFLAIHRLNGIRNISEKFIDLKKVFEIKIGNSYGSVNNMNLTCKESTDGISYDVLSKSEQDYRNLYCDTHIKEGDLNKIFRVLVDKNKDFTKKVIPNEDVKYFNLTENFYIPYKNYTIMSDSYVNSDYNIETTKNFARNKNEFYAIMDDKNGLCNMITDKNFKLVRHNSHDSYVKVQSQQFSYSFWIKVKDIIDEYRLLFYKGPVDEIFPINDSVKKEYTHVPSVWIDKNNTGIIIFIRTLDKLEKITINSGYIPINEYVHVCFTVMSKIVKVYIDGNLIYNKQFSSSVYSDHNSPNNVQKNHLYVNPDEVEGVEISKLILYPFSIIHQYNFNKNTRIDNWHRVNKNVLYLINYNKPDDFKKFWYDTEKPFEKKNLYLLDHDQSHLLFNNITNSSKYKLSEPYYVNYHNIIFLSGSIQSLPNKHILELPKNILPSRVHTFIGGPCFGENLNTKMMIETNGIVTLDKYFNNVNFTLNNIVFSIDESTKFMAESLRKTKFIMVVSNNTITLGNLELFDIDNKLISQDEYTMSMLNEKLLEISLKKEILISKVSITNNTTVDKFNINFLGSEIRLIDVNRELINYRIWDDRDYIDTNEINTTMNGETCQKWSSQEPHSHDYDDKNWRSKAFKLGDHNFCRNPDPDNKDSLWCYTQNKDKEWEYCKVGDQNLSLDQKIYPNKKTFFFSNIFYADTITPPSYNIVDNIVILSGKVKCDEVISNNDPIIGFLPKELCPSSRKTFNVYGNNTSKNVRVDILKNGTIILITNNNKNGNFENNTIISLNGIHYRKNDENGSRLYLTDSFQSFNYVDNNYGNPMKHIKDNLVSLSGIVIIVGNDIDLEKDNIMAKLPYKFRPNDTLFFQVNQNSNAVTLEINPDGNIHVKNFDKNQAFISLDGIFYYISKGKGRIEAEKNNNLIEGGSINSVKLKAREKYNKANQKVIQDRVNLAIISGSIDDLEKIIPVAEEYNIDQSNNNVSERFKVDLKSAKDLLESLKAKKIIYDKLMNSMKKIEYPLIEKSLSEAMEYNTLVEDKFKINKKFTDSASIMIQYLKIKEEKENLLMNAVESENIIQIKDLLLSSKLYNNSVNNDFDINLNSAREKLKELYKTVIDNMLTYPISNNEEMRLVISNNNTLIQDLKNYNNTLDEDELFFKIEVKKISDFNDSTIKKSEFFTLMNEIQQKSDTEEMISILDRLESYNNTVESLFKIDTNSSKSYISSKINNELNVTLNLPINTDTSMSNSYQILLGLINTIVVYNDKLNNYPSLENSRFTIELEEANKHKNSIEIKTRYINDIYSELNKNNISSLTEQLLNTHSYNQNVIQIYKISLDNAMIVLRNLVLDIINNALNLEHNPVNDLRNSVNLISECLTKVNNYNSLVITENKYKIVNELDDLKNIFDIYQSKLNVYDNENGINNALLNPNLDIVSSSIELANIHNNTYSATYNVDISELVYLKEMFLLRVRIVDDLQKLLNTNKIVDSDDNSYSISVLISFIDELKNKINSAKEFNNTYEENYHILMTPYYTFRDMLINKKNIENNMLNVTNQPIDTIENLVNTIIKIKETILNSQTENNNNATLYTINTSISSNYLDKITNKRNLLENLYTSMGECVKYEPKVNNITNLESIIKEIQDSHNILHVNKPKLLINLENAQSLKTIYSQLFNVYKNPNINTLSVMKNNIISYNNNQSNSVLQIDQISKIDKLSITISAFRNLSSKSENIMIQPKIENIPLFKTHINDIKTYSVTLQSMWENDINNYVNMFKIESYNLENMLNILESKKEIEGSLSIISNNPTKQNIEALNNTIRLINVHNNKVSMYFEERDDVLYLKFNEIDKLNNLATVLTSHLQNKSTLNQITAVGVNGEYPTINTIQNLRNTIKNVENHNQSELSLPRDIDINNYDIDVSRAKKFEDTIVNRNSTNNELVKSFNQAVRKNDNTIEEFVNFSYDLNKFKENFTSGAPAAASPSLATASGTTFTAVPAGPTIGISKCDGNMCKYVDNFREHINLLPPIINNLEESISLGNSYNNETIQNIWGNELNPEITNKYTLNISNAENMLSTLKNYKNNLKKINDLFKDWNVVEDTDLQDTKINVENNSWLSSSIDTLINQSNNGIQDINASELDQIIEDIILYNQQLENTWKFHPDYDNILLKYTISTEFLEKLLQTIRSCSNSVTKIKQALNNPTITGIDQLELSIDDAIQNNNFVKETWSTFYKGMYNLTIIKKYSINLDKLSSLLTILKSKQRSQRNLEFHTGRNYNQNLPNLSNKQNLDKSIIDAKSHNNFVNITNDIPTNLVKQSYILETNFGEDLSNIIQNKKMVNELIDRFTSTTFVNIDIFNEEVKKLKPIYNEYAVTLQNIANKYPDKTNDIMFNYKIESDLLTKQTMYKNNQTLLIVSKMSELKNKYISNQAFYQKQLEIILGSTREEKLGKMYKLALVGSTKTDPTDSRKPRWCEISEVRFFDSNNIDISSTIESVEYLIPPSNNSWNAEKLINNVAWSRNQINIAPSPSINKVRFATEGEGFAIWDSYNGNDWNGKDLILFSFKKIIDVRRIEIYTTNYQKFGYDAKLRTLDDNIVFNTGVNGGLSIHYRDNNNQVYINNSIITYDQFNNQPPIFLDSELFTDIEKVYLREYALLKNLLEKITTYNNNSEIEYKNIVNLFKTSFIYEYQTLKIRDDFVKKLIITAERYNQVFENKQNVLKNPNTFHISNIDTCINSIKENNQLLNSFWKNYEGTYKTKIIEKYFINFTKMETLVQILKYKLASDTLLNKFVGKPDSVLPVFKDINDLRTAIDSADNFNDYLSKTSSIPTHLSKDTYIIETQLPKSLFRLVTDNNQLTNDVNAFLSKKWITTESLISALINLKNKYDNYQNLLDVTSKIKIDKKSNILSSYNYSIDLFEKDFENLIGNISNLENTYQNIYLNLGNKIKNICSNKININSKEDYQVLSQIKTVTDNWNTNELISKYNSITSPYKSNVFSFDTDKLKINTNILDKLLLSIDSFNKNTDEKKNVLSTPTINNVTNIENCLSNLEQHNQLINDTWGLYNGEYKQNIVTKYYINTEKMKELVKILRSKLSNYKNLNKYTGRGSGNSLPSSSDQKNITDAIGDTRVHNQYIDRSPIPIPDDLEINRYKINTDLALDLKALLAKKDVTNSEISNFLSKNYKNIDTLISDINKVKTIYDSYNDSLNTVSNTNYPTNILIENFNSENEFGDRIKSTYSIDIDLLSKTTFSGNQEILQLTQSLENMRNENINKSETLISKQNEIVNKKFILDTNDPIIEYNELNQIYEDVLEYNNKLKDNFENLLSAYETSFSFDYNSLLINLNFTRLLLTSIDNYNKAMILRQNTLRNPTTSNLNRIRSLISLIDTTNQQLNNRWQSYQGTYSKDDIIIKYTIDKSRIVSLLEILDNKKMVDDEINLVTGNSPSSNKLPTLSELIDLENAIVRVGNYNDTYVANNSNDIPDDIDKNRYLISPELGNDLNSIIIFRNQTFTQITDFLKITYTSIPVLVNKMNTFKKIDKSGIYDKYVIELNQLANKYPKKKNSIIDAYNIDIDIFQDSNFNKLIEDLISFNNKNITKKSEMNTLINTIIDTSSPSLDNNNTGVLEQTRLLTSELINVTNLIDQLNLYNDNIESEFLSIKNQFKTDFKFNYTVLSINLIIINKLSETIKLFNETIQFFRNALKNITISGISNLQTAKNKIDDFNMYLDTWNTLSIDNNLVNKVKQKFKLIQVSTKLGNLIQLLISKYNTKQFLDNVTGVSPANNLPTFQNKQELNQAISNTINHNESINQATVFKESDKTRYIISKNFAVNLKTLIIEKNKLITNVNNFLQPDTPYTLTNIINQLVDLKNQFNNYDNLLDSIIKSYPNKPNIRKTYSVNITILNNENSNNGSFELKILNIDENTFRQGIIQRYTIDYASLYTILQKMNVNFESIKLHNSKIDTLFTQKSIITEQDFENLKIHRDNLEVYNSEVRENYNKLSEVFNTNLNLDIDTILTSLSRYNNQIENLTNLFNKRNELLGQITQIVNEILNQSSNYVSGSKVGIDTEKQICDNYVLKISNLIDQISTFNNQNSKSIIDITPQVNILPNLKNLYAKRKALLVNFNTFLNKSNPFIDIRKYSDRTIDPQQFSPYIEYLNLIDPILTNINQYNNYSIQNVKSFNTVIHEKNIIGNKYYQNLKILCKNKYILSKAIYTYFTNPAGSMCNDGCNNVNRFNSSNSVNNSEKIRVITDSFDNGSKLIDAITNYNNSQLIESDLPDILRNVNLVTPDSYKINADNLSSLIDKIKMGTDASNIVNYFNIEKNLIDSLVRLKEGSLTYPEFSLIFPNRDNWRYEFWDTAKSSNLTLHFSSSNDIEIQIVNMTQLRHEQKGVYKKISNDKYEADIGRPPRTVNHSWSPWGFLRTLYNALKDHSKLTPLQNSWNDCLRSRKISFKIESGDFNGVSGTLITNVFNPNNVTTQAKLSERGNVQDNINNISSNTCDGIFIPTQDIIDKLQNSMIQMNNYNTSLDSVFNTVGIRISENFYLKFEPELISKVNTLATKLENKINIQSGLPQMLANPNTRIENLTQKYESVNNYNNNLESDGIFCDKMKINSNNLTDRLNKLVKLVGDRTSLITRINNSKNQLDIETFTVDSSYDFISSGDKELLTQLLKLRTDIINHNNSDLNTIYNVNLDILNKVLSDAVNEIVGNLTDNNVTASNINMTITLIDKRVETIQKYIDYYNSVSWPSFISDNPVLNNITLLQNLRNKLVYSVKSVLEMIQSADYSSLLSNLDSNTNNVADINNLKNICTRIQYDIENADKPEEVILTSSDDSFADPCNNVLGPTNRNKDKQIIDSKSWTNKRIKNVTVLKVYHGRQTDNLLGWNHDGTNRLRFNDRYKGMVGACAPLSYNSRDPFSDKIGDAIQGSKIGFPNIRGNLIDQIDPDIKDEYLKKFIGPASRMPPMITKPSGSSWSPEDYVVASIEDANGNYTTDSFQLQRQIRDLPSDTVNDTSCIRTEDSVGVGLGGYNTTPILRYTEANTEWKSIMKNVETERQNLVDILKDLVLDGKEINNRRSVVTVNAVSGKHARLGPDPNGRRGPYNLPEKFPDNAVIIKGPRYGEVSHAILKPNIFWRDFALSGGRRRPLPWSWRTNLTYDSSKNTDIRLVAPDLPTKYTFQPVDLSRFSQFGPTRNGEQYIKHKYLRQAVVNEARGRGKFSKDPDPHIIYRHYCYIKYGNEPLIPNGFLLPEEFKKFMDPAISDNWEIPINLAGLTLQGRDNQPLPRTWCPPLPTNSNFAIFKYEAYQYGMKVNRLDGKGFVQLKEEDVCPKDKDPIQFLKEEINKPTSTSKAFKLVSCDHRLRGIDKPSTDSKYNQESGEYGNTNLTRQNRCGNLQSYSYNLGSRYFRSKNNLDITSTVVPHSMEHRSGFNMGDYIRRNQNLKPTWNSNSISGGPFFNLYTRTAKGFSNFKTMASLNNARTKDNGETIRWSDVRPNHTPCSLDEYLGENNTMVIDGILLKNDTIFNSEKERGTCRERTRGGYVQPFRVENLGDPQFRKDKVDGVNLGIYYFEDVLQVTPGGILNPSYSKSVPDNSNIDVNQYQSSVKKLLTDDLDQEDPLVVVPPDYGGSSSMPAVKIVNVGSSNERYEPNSAMAEESFMMAAQKHGFRWSGMNNAIPSTYHKLSAFSDKTIYHLYQYWNSIYALIDGEKAALANFKQRYPTAFTITETIPYDPAQPESTGGVLQYYSWGHLIDKNNKSYKLVPQNPVWGWYNSTHLKGYDKGIAYLSGNNFKNWESKWAINTTNFVDFTGGIGNDHIIGGGGCAGDVHRSDTEVDNCVGSPKKTFYSSVWGKPYLGKKCLPDSSLFKNFNINDPYMSKNMIWIKHGAKAKFLVEFEPDISGIDTDKFLQPPYSFVVKEIDKFLESTDYVRETFTDYPYKNNVKIHNLTHTSDAQTNNQDNNKKYLIDRPYLNDNSAFQTYTHNNDYNINISNYYTNNLSNTYSKYSQPINLYDRNYFKIDN